jgi:cobalt-zinc-cadmium efflux system membrane fusion protein
MNGLKNPAHIDRCSLVLSAMAAMLLAAGALTSRGEPPASNSASGSGAASNASSTNITVELSSNQLNAIKIAPLETHLFPVEKEAVGSISFDEDPVTIQAESTLLAAAGTLQVNSNELARARSLYTDNGVAQRELDQATSDAQSAQASFKAARMALRALGKTDAEIDELLADGAIRSAAHGPAKWALANVLESDSPLVQVGQPVKVSVVALPGRKFDGKVSQVYATLDPNLHHLPVRCKLDDPKDELRPGMLANVTIQIAEPVESIAVPPNGVVREGDGTMTAWVTTDRQHFTQRIVKIGMREDGQVQILDGLRHDKLVVTDGAIFLDNIVNATPSD